MGKGFKAGLMALTALVTITPALAQEHGGGRDRGMGHGMERPGGSQRGENGGGFGGGFGGGAQRPDRPQGNAPQGNWPQRSWNGNDGGQPPRADIPRPVESARPIDRNGQAESPWQAQPGQPVIRPSVGTESPRRGDDRPDRNWRGDTHQPDGRWNRDGRPGGNPTPSTGWQNRGPDRGGPDSDRWNGVDNRRPIRSDTWEGRNDAQRPPNWQRQPNWQADRRIGTNDRWRDQQRWSNDWRRDDRYDWSGYRQSNRSAYRLPRYRPPSGWSNGYSRFSIGLFLGGPLYSNSYWIDDPYSYRLPPAYGTLRWVRYYDDALLVDIRDGYVVDVIHSFFFR